MRTKLFNIIKVSALALALSFGLSYVYAWTAPTQNPPAGNVSAPINTSGTAQTKAGALTVGGFNISMADNYYTGVSITGENFSAGDLATRVRIQDKTGNIPWFLSANNDGKFALHQGSVGDRITVDNANGNVGVGDPAPANKLSVFGPVGATGDICTMTTGSPVCLSTAGGGGAFGSGYVWKVMYSTSPVTNITTDCTGSRSLSTTVCTNNSAYPIMVMIKNQVSQGAGANIYVNNVVGGYAYSSIYEDGSATTIVPPGATYKVGPGTVYYWSELRCDSGVNCSVSGSNNKEILLSGTWLGNAAASQGNASNPRYTSIEILPAVRDKCRMDIGLNPCRLTIVSINKNGVPRVFDHFFTTRKEGTKEYVFIEETTYDNSLVIGDGVVQHMDAGAWVAGCNWRNTNDGNDGGGNFAICERKAALDGTWYDSAKDDISLWLTVDQQDMVSTYYYLYK